jgi:hypothetical protein
MSRSVARGEREAVERAEPRSSHRELASFVGSTLGPVHVGNPDHHGANLASEVAQVLMNLARCVFDDGRGALDPAHSDLDLHLSLTSWRPP